MVEIGGRPILWHIMKIYASHGVNDFIVCLGYRGWQIKEYFLNYASIPRTSWWISAPGGWSCCAPPPRPWRIAQ
jgi:glucose-1-phosphate cytidylyltransferase